MDRNNDRHRHQTDFTGPVESLAAHRNFEHEPQNNVSAGFVDSGCFLPVDAACVFL